MAAPTVVNVGTVASGTGAITPALPASLQADDIMIGIAESVGNEAYTVPTGWAHVAGSPINVDTSTRLTVIWRRFVAGDTALSWGDSGNHNVGRIIGIRGAKTSGDPWNVTPTTSQETTANTSAEWPDATTTADDCLIVLCIATGRDLATTTNLGAVTNGNLTSITEQMDNWIATGTGGGIGMVTGVKTSAGAIGTSTATMGSTDSKALMTIALQPSGPPKTTPATLIDYTQTTWSGTGTSKSVAASISWQTGDEIYALGMTADESTTMSAPTVSGLTFNAVGTNPTGAVDNCQGYAFKAVAASASSGTVQGNVSNTTNEWGLAVWQFRGSDGTGTKAANASTAKTVSLSRSNDHSCVIEVIGDWSAAVATSYAWTPTATNDREHAQHTNYTTFAADWGDQGSAGTTSYGISGTASTGVHTKVAVEVLGTVAGGTTANAGTATGAGAASNPSPSIAASATTGTGSGAANNTTSQVKPGPSSATGTGTANNPSPSIQASAGTATGTGVANNATVTTGGAATNAPAGLASGTGTSDNPSASVAPTAGTGSGTSAANNTTSSIKPTAGTATATGTANNATVQTGSFTNAQAGTATGTGTANNTTSKVAPVIGTAAGTGTADNPAVTVGHVASAGTATGTGTANNPAIAIGRTALAGTATGIGTADLASLAISASAEAAAALGEAFDGFIPGAVIFGVGTSTVGWAASTVPIDTHHTSNTLVTSAQGRAGIT